MRPEPDQTVQADPDAQLERAFIAEFLERRGHTAGTVRGLPEPDAHALMAEASRYASARLTEVQARAHYVHEIRDVSRGSE